MKENKTINLSFVHIKELKVPIIEGAFVDKNGQLQFGYYIVDTGAVDNILNDTIIPMLGEDSITNKSDRMYGIDDHCEIASVYNMKTMIGGFISQEEFTVSHNLNLGKHFGVESIIGLLGSRFLYKHQLVVDFEKECLRSSDSEKISQSGKSFFFPMNLGMRFFGSPVVGYVKDNIEYFCIVDTGCSLSTLTDKGMEGAIVCEDHNKKGKAEGLSGNIETKHARISLSLYSYGDLEGDAKVVETEDEFQIISGRDYIIPVKEGVPSISGLLSTEFMLKRNWILDYENLVIYANK